MIAKVCKSGSTPRRLLDYLGKPERKAASVLLTNLGGTSLDDWAWQMRELNRALRPEKGKYVKHFVLSYAQGEHRSADEMRDTARYFLRRMGYRDTPFVCFFHGDTRVDHLHIVTTPTTWSGEWVSERLDRLRSVRIAREIEERWDLQAVKPPEEAYLKSPRQGELKVAAKGGPTSERTALQYEVAQAAKKARSLTEMVEKLTAKGIATRVLLERDGLLKGISFRRGEVAFKGSDLGRAFRAGRILQQYGLAYDPREDRPALERAVEASSAVVAVGGLREVLFDEQRNRHRELMADRERLPEVQFERKAAQQAEVGGDLERVRASPDLPARKLVSLPLESGAPELPEGRYQIAIAWADLKPASEPTYGYYYHDNKSFRIGFDDLTPLEIEGEAERLQRWGRGYVLLVRPTLSEERHVVGFRGASLEQVEALRRDGFEPAVLVRVGEKEHDLWLRLPKEASASEVQEFRLDLERRYGLPSTQKLYSDGIRLPGFSSPVGSGAAHARLLEARNQPVSAWPRWQREVRVEMEGQMRELAKRLDTPSSPNVLPAASALQLGERLPLGFSGGVVDLERRIEREARDSNGQGPPSLAAIPTDDLLAEARLLNREVLREIAPRAGFPLESSKAVERLITVEAEISRRLYVASSTFAEHRTQFLARSEALEAAARQVRADTGLAAIREYQVKAVAWAKDANALERADVALLRLGLAQKGMDRERLEATLKPGKWSEDRRRQCRQIAALEKRLDSRLEGWERHSKRAGDPLAELRGTRGEPSVPSWQDYTRWRSAVAERAMSEESVARLAADPIERLRVSAARVASGDLSPEALRRLNAQVLAQLPASRIALPVFSEKTEVQAHLRELPRLLDEVHRLAGRVASAEPVPPKDLPRLLATGAEAVLRIQQLDEHHRQRHSLALPNAERVPQELGPHAWNAAWIEHSRRLGLPPAVAASHLATASRAPVDSDFRGADRLLSWGLSEGLRAGRAAGRWLGRVLQQ